MVSLMTAFQPLGGEALLLSGFLNCPHVGSLIFISSPKPPNGKGPLFAAGTLPDLTVDMRRSQGARLSASFGSPPCCGPGLSDTAHGGATEDSMAGGDSR